MHSQKIPIVPRTQKGIELTCVVLRIISPKERERDIICVCVFSEIEREKERERERERERQRNVKIEKTMYVLGRCWKKILSLVHLEQGGP